MSASNAFENALLNHILRNANIANVGDATGLRGSTAPGDVYLALHTADPGEAGTQSTSEATYTSYARVAVPRSATGWSEATAGSSSNEEQVDFPTATGGSSTVTHFSIGTSSAGAGMILLSAALDASLAVSNGITPNYAPGTLTVTAD